MREDRLVRRRAVNAITSACFAMAGVLALAGCVGLPGAPGGAGGGDIVACDVLSVDDVSELLEVEVVAETSDNPNGSLDPTGCVYAGETGFPRILVSVHFGKKYYGGIDGLSRQDPVAIEGLGDDAYIDNGAVRFLSGEWACSVSRIGGDVSDEDLKVIALLLESKLP